MNTSRTTSGLATPLASVLACTTMAIVTGRLLSHNAAWLVVFGPAILVDFHYLVKLIQAFGVPVSAGRHEDAENSDGFEPRGHPSEGLINPATGLFITRAGVDISGNGYGMGSRTNQ
jgi:hypothetical protein